MPVDFNTIAWLGPELVLVATASVMFVLGTWTRNRGWWTALAAAAYVLALWLLVRNEWQQLGSGWPETGMPAASGPLLIDHLGHVTRLGALLVGLVFALITARSTANQLAGEFSGTLMLVIVGIMVVARANDLVLLFLGLELISIPTYVLLFLGSRDPSAGEATAKYFFLSVLSSAILLYGMSFVYGVAGTTLIGGTDLNPGIREVVSNIDPAEGLAWLLPIAVVLLLSGFGFKIAAVPFHFYAPDVYQGTTSANAGLLAVAPKIAGIIGMVRLLVVVLPQMTAGTNVTQFAWQLAVALAILTMTIGNVCALWQRNIRRLMAYSSVAHAGYMLIGLAVAFAAPQAGGTAAMLLYLFVYVLATLGTFSALAYLRSEQYDVNNVAELSGLARIWPGTAAAIAACMFSLAGVPPLAGFWGKLTLFSGAVQVAISPETPRYLTTWLTVLAICGALNAAIAAAYYLRVVAVMYFQSPQDRVPAARGGWPAWVATVFCASLVVLVGIVPGPLLRSARRADQEARQALSVTPSVPVAVEHLHSYETRQARVVKP